MRKRLLTEWIELLLLLAMTGCSESAHAQTDCLMSELLQTIKNRDKYLSKKKTVRKSLGWHSAFCTWGYNKSRREMRPGGFCCIEG